MPEGPARVRTSGSTREAIREFFAAERRNAERIEKFNRGLSEEDELPPYVHQEYPKAMYPLGFPDDEPILVENAEQERDRLEQGYYNSLAEQKAAREEFEQDIGHSREEPEEEAIQTVAPKPPPPKRSHKKKPAAA